MRVVSSLEQLAALPRDHQVNGFGLRARLRLEIPSASRHALLRAERNLNRLQSRCGCLSGVLATLAALGAGAFSVARDFAGAWQWWLVPRVALVVVLAFLLGLAVKFLTLAITRWQFAHACHAQHRALVRDAAAAQHRE